MGARRGGLWRRRHHVGGKCGAGIRLHRGRRRDRKPRAHHGNARVRYDGGGHPERRRAPGAVPCGRYSESCSRARHIGGLSRGGHGRRPPGRERVPDALPSASGFRIRNIWRRRGNFGDPRAGRDDRGTYRAHRHQLGGHRVHDRGRFLVRSRAAAFATRSARHSGC